MENTDVPGQIYSVYRGVGAARIVHQKIHVIAFVAFTKVIKISRKWRASYEKYVRRFE